MGFNRMCLLKSALHFQKQLGQKKPTKGNKQSRNKDRSKRAKDRKTLDISRDSETTSLLSYPWLPAEQDRKRSTGSSSISIPSPRSVASRHQSSQTTFSCFDSKFDSGFHVQERNELTQNTTALGVGIQYRRPEGRALGVIREASSAKRPDSYQLSLIELPFEDCPAQIASDTIRNMLKRYIYQCLLPYQHAWPSFPIKYSAWHLELSLNHYGIIHWIWFITFSRVIKLITNSSWF